MWQLIRGRQIAGAKFRRQHPLQPYVLDFYCPELELAIELDGGQHNEPAGREHDSRRDDFLAAQGIRTLRFWNNQVLAETETVLEVVHGTVVEAQGRIPSPCPLPAGEGNYADFALAVTDRRALADIVNGDKSVAAAHEHFLGLLETWWKKHLPHIEALAPEDGNKGNVYDLRRLLLASIESALAQQHLLSDHQIRGGLARYFEFFKPEFKSIAFSGWGPELIPDDEILQSQFPEVLTQMEVKRTRIAELTALFAEADEEDYEDEDETGILPGNQVKELKAKLKQLKGEAKLAKRDPNLGDYKVYEKEAAAVEAKLKRHKAFEDEAKQLKADLRATEKKQDELVAVAREKIDRDEARRVIIERLHCQLIQTYESYLRADQRACLAALENLYDKYADTAADIEQRRDAATAKLKGFLGELGYA